MNNSDFQKLLAEQADKTPNIRAAASFAFSGVNRIPEEIVTKIGSVVSLLQSQVNKGCFCNKDEYLLVYNFQPLLIEDENYFCSLDMVVKPTEKMNELNNSSGKPLQLVINGTTGEVMNNVAGMAAMGIPDEEEQEEELPAIYGNYKDYSNPQNFMERLTFIEILTDIGVNQKSSEVKIANDKVSGSDLSLTFKFTSQMILQTMSLSDFNTDNLIPSPNSAGTTGSSNLGWAVEAINVPKVLCTA
jgi:hypothetical protein